MEARLNPVIGLYTSLLKTVVLLFLCFQTAATVLFHLPTIIDEVIQFILVLIIFYKSFSCERARFVFYAYLALNLFLLLISFESLGHRGIVNVIFQVYVHTKYIIYLGFLVLFYSPKSLRAILLFTLVVSFFFLLFDLAFPGVLNSLFDAKILMRGGVIRPIGVQAHTGTLGFFMAFVSVFILTFYNKMAAKYWYSLFLLLAVLVLLTSVRTAMLAFPVVLLWLFKDSLKHAVLIVVLAVPLLIMASKTNYAAELVNITQQNIEMSIDDPEKNAYIRGMMIYFSFVLANDRFPFGTGAASFGTVRSDDSNIYAELGVHNSRFFIDKDGIYDSNFASLLGEFGYLGAFIYYGFFVYFLLSAKLIPARYSKSGFAFAGTLLFIAYSFTNPVFMNTYQIFIFSLCFASSLVVKEGGEEEV